MGLFNPANEEESSTETGKSCPKCGETVHREKIENEAIHTRRYCKNCSWGYIKG